MIPSVEWVKAYRQRQIRFQHLYKDFLRTKTFELANKLIVDPIIEEMRANDFSEKIYNAVEVDDVLVNDDGILIRIKNEFFAEKDDGSLFDVALAREEGTDDHMIKPKDTNESGKLHWIQNGKHYSSKGHMVSGLPRLSIIQNTIESGEFELQNKLNEEFQKWKSQVFSN